MTARVVICCGSGGVGKTTVSAALAIRLAREGHRVAVLTIDPARRLADSLGIGELGNTARRVPLERVDPDCSGSLDAMMLDAKATFDDLIRRVAPSSAAAERILGNRYYRFASQRLGGSHEYMAMEKLLDLWQTGPYDVIVLDTPPTRHALDFLHAPDRMAGLFDQGVMRWLVMPATQGGWRALELGSEVVARVLERILGRGTIGEIAEFFEDFRDLWDGFTERSKRVNALLGDPATRFMLVTSPAEAAQTEALYFLEVLRARGLPFGGFVLNRVTEAPAHAPGADSLAAARPASIPPERWAEITAGVATAVELRAATAARQQARIAHLRGAGPADAPMWLVPEADADLHDLTDLAALGPHLPAAPWSPGGPPAT
jgi:anion-transporting  ArsA/GET3 family ATPase